MFEQGAQYHHTDDGDGDAGGVAPVEQLRRGVPVGLVLRGAEVGDDERDSHGGCRNQPDDRQRKQYDQASAVASRAILLLVEIHQKATLGAAWISALSSNSSRLASLPWPNMPASNTGGKLWR